MNLLHPPQTILSVHILKFRETVYISGKFMMLTATWIWFKCSSYNFHINFLYENFLYNIKNLYIAVSLGPPRCLISQTSLQQRFCCWNFYPNFSSQPKYFHQKRISAKSIFIKSIFQTCPSKPKYFFKKNHGMHSETLLQI